MLNGVYKLFDVELSFSIGRSRSSAMIDIW